MKKILFLILCITCFLGFAQCPPPGNIILSSQKGVNEFARIYGNCSLINGNLTLTSGLSDASNPLIISDIVDISPLNFLESISGNLRITVNVTEIIGFNNLLQVRGDVDITNCRNLTIISGFNNLNSANNIIIALNPVLKRVEGFNKIETIIKGLEIGFGDSLEEIDGFTNLKTIRNQLNISENPLLSKIPSFNKLEQILDDLNLTSNPSLNLVEGFEQLTFVGNDLNLESIKEIRGFNALKTIDRFLDIRGFAIEEIPEFQLLETVGASLTIENTSLKSITNFNSLKVIGEKYFLDDWFSISNNQYLNNVTGFGRFAKVEGDVKVQNNPLLDDCSWLCNLINNGEITGALTIQDNLGDCLNSLAVILICNIDFDNDRIANAIDLDDDNDGILDTLEGNGFVDTDNDGFPDSMDLDADNDNCFDVREAGFGDSNNDGILGDLPDTVNFQGLIINESTGYTTPDDTNRNRVFDFQELNLLSPGKNGLLEVCKNFLPVDLFKSLNGNPNLGGSWSPTLASSSSIFNPKIDAAGIYTYTQTDPICGDLKAEVKVAFLSELSAGIDAEILICEGLDRVDLLESLNGNPSPNGFWSPELNSGTNLYDKRFDVDNKYTYTVVDEKCGTLQAEVTIKNLNRPNSGENAIIQICEFSEPINLFDLLKGNPDTNGVWSPVLPNNVFDPKNDDSNTFSYSVDNGACGFSTSTVNIEVVKNKALNNVGILINDFSSVNNNVEIAVYSNREYEFSLDGINYQTKNIFNNVNGGKQTIYVRGKDGCEFFSKNVFIRTYPIFFTPNNDGKNDFWRLKDFPDVNYTIFIYSRFGQMIKEIKSTTGFWDGNFNGKPMQTSDYWFKVIINETGEVLHGNFSLLRK